MHSLGFFLEKKTCHLSPVTCPLSPVTCHLSPVTCQLSPVTCKMSPETCHLSPVTCHLSHVTCTCTYTQRWKNTFSFHRSKFLANIILPKKKCKNCDKIAKNIFYKKYGIIIYNIYVWNFQVFGIKFWLSLLLFQHFFCHFFFKYIYIA